MSAPEVTICAKCQMPIWSGYWTLGTWRHYRATDHAALPSREGSPIEQRDEAVRIADELGIDLMRTPEDLH